MKKRIVQFVMVLCGFGILIGLMLPSLVGGGPSKIGTARTEMVNLTAALVQYRIEFGENLSVAKAKCMKILLGDNSKKIKFIDVRSKSMGTRGEFLDPWKTAYEIKLEQTNYTIRSAGPNKIFGDKDDLTNSPSVH